LPKSEPEILKGYLSMLPIQIVTHASQSPSYPESVTLWKEVDEKSENSKEQIDEIREQRNHPTILIRPTSQSQTKIVEISPHPLPLPSGERGRVRGQKC
jgi:hypothetical protein